MIVSEERYLAHYGIPGMKWGKRKAMPVSATRSNFDRRKEAYKMAKKQYNKDFNSAFNKNSPFSLSKKRRESNTQRWEKTADSADALNKAQAAYKKAKKDRKQKMKSAYKEINKTSNFLEKVVYNSATRKKAAQYVVDNNMSISDAKKKANQLAVKNTTTLLATIGAATLISKRIGR